MSDPCAQSGSAIAVRVEGLGKRYLLGETHASPLSARIAGLPRRLFGKLRPACADAAEFWALRDVSFELAKGDALGIVGGNGAGKSTLLKILSRITPPTLGRARVRGRLASLLEVGTGFHPELTGRENVFLNGTILGMRNAEITRKFDEIVAFSGVERFIDTPIKRYSSGMHVRLAFAVAAHLEPDVLILDEVLAVGDAEFQRRCLGKMGDVTREGRTVIFVSHNLAAVRELCKSAILLERGRLVCQGTADHVIEQYLRENEAAQLGTTCSEYAYLNEEDEAEAFVQSVQFLDAEQKLVASASTLSRLTIRIALRTRRALPRITLGLAIGTLEGTRLLQASTHSDRAFSFTQDAGIQLVDLTFDQFPLNPGRFIVGIAISIPRERLWANARVCELQVCAPNGPASRRKPRAPDALVASAHKWTRA